MKKWVSILLLVVAALGIWVAGSLNTSLVERRAIHELDAGEPLKNVPPLIAFTTVVLGGFRGIIADVLWLRVSFLQDSGRYLELVQLSDWITKLEPRSSEIWAFHAWNMAYNVSVVMPEAEDRWRWVRSGLRLLRDEGLAYNSADPALYCELGWLFQHKIGQTIDPTSAFYRRRWAAEMDGFFEGGRANYAQMAADTGMCKHMVDEYKLIPEIMEAIDARYGPLDWRLPETHVVYWAYRGLQQARHGRSLPCHRMIFQAMATTFSAGHLVVRASDGEWVRSPHPELLPKVVAAYEAALADDDDESVKIGYINFLQDAIWVFRRLGRQEEARHVFERWVNRFPAEAPPIDFEAFIAAGDRRAELVTREDGTITVGGRR